MGQRMGPRQRNKRGERDNEGCPDLGQKTARHGGINI